MFGVGWPPVGLATPDPGPEDCGCGPSCGPCTANFGEGAPLDLDDVRFGSGLPGFQDATGYPDVEVILSAGPKEEQSDGIPHSCDPDNAQTCSLYRIVIWSGRALVQRVRGRFEDHGYVQPSISPDGSEVAYVVKGEKDDDHQTSIRIAATRLPGGPGTHRSVYDPSDGVRGVQWPDWWDSTTVLFDAHTSRNAHPSQQDHRVFEVDTTGGSPAQILPAYASGAPIDSALDFPNERWGDVEVKHNAISPDVSMVAQHQGLDSRVYPRVVRLDPNKRVVFEEHFAETTLPGGSRKLRQCHHPTWSPSGQSVACFGHAPRVEYLNWFVRPVYRFDRNPGAAPEWQAAGLLFPIPSPLEVATSFGSILTSPLFPLPSGAGTCETYAFKYPRWIRRDFVVVTLYCERNREVISSRTVLVRLSDGRIFDLVRFVEATQGVPRNSWRGHTGDGRPERAELHDVARASTRL